jgi:hypothetical protein
MSTCLKDMERRRELAVSRRLGVPRDDSKPGSGRTAVVVWPKGLTVMAFDGVESMEEKRRSCTLTWPRAEPCRFLDAGLRMVSTRSAQISEGVRRGSLAC